MIWGEKAYFFRAKERPGTGRDSGAQVLAPNGSDKRPDVGIRFFWQQEVSVDLRRPHLYVFIG